MAGVKTAGQRVVGESGRVRPVDDGAAEQGGPEPLDEAAVEVLDDEHEPAAPVVIGPARQDRRNVHDVLDAVDHDRAVRVLGQGDKAFHAQQLRTVGGAQEVEEEVEGAAADGFVCGQAKRPDAGVVAVDVMRMNVAVRLDVRCGRPYGSPPPQPLRR